MYKAINESVFLTDASDALAMLIFLNWSTTKAQKGHACVPLPRLDSLTD